MSAELREVLVDLVNSGNASDGELAEWANEFLFWVGDDFFRDTDWEKVVKLEADAINKLRQHIGQYVHPTDLPRLPREPNGQLFGVGFIYDEDEDDRILLAIDRIAEPVVTIDRITVDCIPEPAKRLPEKACDHVIAVAEHEGNLEIYTRLPHVRIGQLDVGHDTWQVAEFVPFNGRWRQVDQQFIVDCIAHVIGFGKPNSGKKSKDQPPTSKQLGYLKGLGYQGEPPTTKEEASYLINEFKGMQ